ncbi:hypothetical protein E2C01_091580 [Portunus trituberculatus]|uniref:Uncharacterized protein n=1 Tax=Portunus trituberculatus TaxID=210409 RepID=A0A5B7JT87_PORTR|nr:hypothetical protein [Portunus trituberculatus]
MSYLASFPTQEGRTLPCMPTGLGRSGSMQASAQWRKATSFTDRISRQGSKVCLWPLTLPHTEGKHTLSL